jgi:hypothetical protein
LITGLLNWQSVAAMAQTPDTPPLKPGWKLVDANGRFAFHLPQDMQEQNVHEMRLYKRV